jgi:hypothetical protein
MSFEIRQAVPACGKYSFGKSEQFVSKKRPSLLKNSLLSLTREGR